MQIKQQPYDVGVIVGRFQVPELHQGHRDLIHHVRGQHDKTIIVLGVSPIWASSHNPLDFQARRQMLHAEFPHVEIAYVKDQPSDERWSARLDAVVGDLVTPGQTAVLYGARDSFIRHYHGTYDTRVLEAEQVFSGTAVRNKVKAAATRGSDDFRAGVIWATGARYPVSYPTVDVAILDGERLLLGRKEGEEKYRFVGGFADPASGSYEADAMREVREETGLSAGRLKYVGSALIDDWRYRNEPDSIKTLFFTAQYLFGHPKAADDLAEVRWFNIDALKTSDVVREHRPLLFLLADELGLTPPEEK